MKIIWFLAIISLLAIGCNDNHQASKDKDTASAVKHDHEEAAGKLELNNGVRWKADSSTNNNVRNLQGILDRFIGGTDRSIGAFQSTANELQAGLDKMISECKMKGADHDALHKWLEPLIGNISALKKTTSEKEAGEIVNETDAHLKLYAQYFE